MIIFFQPHEQKAKIGSEKPKKFWGISPKIKKILQNRFNILPIYTEL
jgi:hypothetical protein